MRKFWVITTDGGKCFDTTVFCLNYCMECSMIVFSSNLNFNEIDSIKYEYFIHDIII